MSEVPPVLSWRPIVVRLKDNPGIRSHEKARKDTKKHQDGGG